MHLPAAELLLKQFLKASDDIISKIPPQENFIALLSEPKFTRSLASLRLLVQHNLSLLLRHLDGWRSSTHAYLTRMPDRTERDRIVTFSKRAAMEVINFEAALQLLDMYTDEFLENKEFVEYYDGLQRSAFRVLLIAEDVFPPDLASLYKVVVAEAARVLGAITRKISLSHVVEPFVTALSDRINPRKDPSGAKPNYDVLRAQIVRLSSGMRHVSLSFDSEEAVQKAVSFLTRVHPLNHTAPIKKSQIHHALADMLTSILLPLVRSDAPQKGAALLGPPALERWYSTVMSMRNDITSWMNKHQKHINDGYPLSITLLCLASDKDYSAHVDTAADFLHKGLKVKENRAVCVRCLVVLACSYLVRYGRHIIKHELHKWLDRVTKPITQLAKKGGLTIAEQMEVIAPIAELSPEFALQYLILELLTSDVNDCVLAGLRSLQALILTAPAVAAGAGQEHQRPGSTPGLAQGPGGATTSGYGTSAYNGNGSSGGGASIASSGSSSGLQALLRRAPATSFGGLLYGTSSYSAASLASTPSIGGGGGGAGGASSAVGPAGGVSGVTAAAFAPVNDMLRRGLHPLEVLGVTHLLPRISAAIAKLLGTWHPLYGTNLLYSAPDPNWKEKSAGFSLILTLVRLLPYLKPDTWVNSRPLDVLPSYTCHAEQSMRIVSEEALLSLVRGCPHLRNNVVCSFAAFTAALPDDAIQSVRDSQRLLRDLMELWIALLAERAAGDAVEAAGGAGAGAGAEALTLDVHRLEGYALVCMASHDEPIRREALQALHLIRALHQAVLSAEPYEPAPSPILSKAGAGAAGSMPRNVSNGGLTVTAAAGGAGLGAGPHGGARNSHGPSSSRESLELCGGGTDGSATPGLMKSAPAHGMAEGPDLEPPTYLIELVEESGPALLRATYWDFGEWSDMWRQYKEVPDNASFEEVLAASARPADEVPRVRLARALLELMGLAVRLVPASAGVAAVEMVARLGRMLGRTQGEGRLVLLNEYMDSGRRDAWRNCSAIVCACPQALRDRMQEKLGRRLPPISSRDIIRVHLGLITASATAASSGSQVVPPTVQLCSMMSLGHLSPDMYGILLEEMQPYIDEYLSSSRAGSASKSKSKMRDELRRCLAHVFRVLSERVPAEALSSNPLLRSRLLEFIRDTYGLLRQVSISTDAYWDSAQVAYCLTAVIRNVAVPLRQLLSQPIQGGSAATVSGSATPQQLQRDSQGRADAAAGATVAGGGAGATGAPPAGGSGAAGISLRKVLWEMILLWCEEAYILLKDLKAVVAAVPAGNDISAALRTCAESNYSRALNMGIGAVLHKFKESPEGLREELHQAAHYINHSARLALAALLEGPVFDNDTRRPTGPVFAWIDKLLAVRFEGPHSVAGPPRRVVGHRALRGLLTHNPDLFEACLDKCYDSNYSLASGYFQVMCEVYGTQPVRCPPHIILALVLVKVVDPSQEVREDALHMLNVLSQREWQSGPAGGPHGPGEQGSHQAAVGPGLGPGASSPSALRNGPSPVTGDVDTGAAGGSPGGVGGDDPAVLVIGSLQDSYHQFQYGLAGNLAREHPELSEALCEEMMTRQLECEDGTIQHPVLTSLAPWMENLIISFPWKGNWSERLLKSLYYVTLRHGTKFPSEIQGLWTQLAKRTRNINPILDFLLHLGMATALQTDLNAMLEFFGVSKRIVLYLARVSPTETIGYLAIELAKQQQEEGEPGAGAGGADAAAAVAGPSGAVPGGAGVGGSRASGVKGDGGAGGPLAPYPHVLVFGGPLDCVVAGEDRTMYTSYESGPSLSSASWGGAASVSTGQVDPSAGGMGSAAGGAGSHRNHNSLDQGVRPLSGRSEASGSSRSDANGLGGGAGGGGGAGAGAGAGAGGGSSLADSATGAVRGLLGGLGFGSSDHRLRPADDSRSAGAGPGASGAGPGAGAGTGAAAGAGDLRASHSPAASPSRAAAVGTAIKALLTRPELVLCCLAEVVYEHEVDPQHLPLLLHVALTCGDHEEPVVAAHCQQLIVNLLYSRSAHWIDQYPDVTSTSGVAPGSGAAAAVPAGGFLTATAAFGATGADTASPSFAAAPPDVAAVIRHLQSFRGRRLWPWEEFSLAGSQAVAAASGPDGHLLSSAAALGSLTVAVTEALPYEPHLAMEWAARALDWAQHARSRHAACRSWQVLRALRPPLKADLAAALVLSLEACFQSGQMAGCEVAVEIITTTRLLVGALPPGRLVLYPQLWWAALALLHSPHVAVYRAALGLVGACLGPGEAGVPGPQLRLAASKVQAVLLAAAPGLSAGQLLAASHAAAMQDNSEDPDPWVLGYHVLNVREAMPQLASPHGSIAVQQLLLRGLTHPLTVAPTLHLLAAFGDALAQQAQALLARTGPGGLIHMQSQSHLQPSRQPPLLGGSAASSSGGGGVSQQQQHGSNHLSQQPSLPRGAMGLDGDAIDESVFDAAGVNASRTASGVIGRATLVPHSDSLRKHRALKLDSFQTLLGSCRSQLFVSLMGLLPLVLSLHGTAASGGGGLVGGDVGGGSAAASTASEDFPRLQPLHHSRAARSVAAASAAAAGGAPVTGLSFGAGGGVDEGELLEAIQRAVAALGRAAAVLGLGPEIGAHLQVLSSPQLSLDPVLLESTTIQLLTLVSRALFPRYACWFLHHMADLLVGGTTATWASAAAGSAAAAAAVSGGAGGGSFAAAAAAAAAAAGVAIGGGEVMPPGPRQVRSALLMLRCLFRVDGLRLGPAAAVLLADGTLLQPVVALSAGPMGGMAIETLAAALQYSQDDGFQRDLREASARATKYEQQQPQQHSTTPRTLFPPGTSVAAALKKVVDTMGSGLRRRNKHMKLLPFLGVYND